MDFVAQHLAGAFAGGEEPPLGKHEEGIGASEADAETSADTTDASTPDTSEKASDTENTLATLDMILTIVGEVFRQRDLLEFRRPWENEECNWRWGISTIYTSSCRTVLSSPPAL